MRQHHQELPIRDGHAAGQWPHRAGQMRWRHGSDDQRLSSLQRVLIRFFSIAVAWLARSGLFRAQILANQDARAVKSALRGFPRDAQAFRDFAYGELFHVPQQDDLSMHFG